MQTYFLASFILALVGCGTINNPDMCRYVQGPASITVQGAATGGTVMATVEQGGTYLSYPRDPNVGCPTVPTPITPMP